MQKVSPMTLIFHSLAWALGIVICSEAPTRQNGCRTCTGLAATRWRSSDAPISPLFLGFALTYADSSWFTSIPADLALILAKTSRFDVDSGQNQPKSAKIYRNQPISSELCRNHGQNICKKNNKNKLVGCIMYIIS